MSRILVLLSTVVLLFAAMPPAGAGDIISGEMIIENPWARATPKSAKVGAGYLKMLNIGDNADRLVSAKSDISARVEIHTMKIEGGVMKMRKLADGLAIAPKSEVVLKPGGYHLMFIDLKAPLEEGEDFNVTLEFEKSGDIDVLFKTSGIGGNSPYPNEDPHAGSGHGVTPVTGSSHGSGTGN